MLIPTKPPQNIYGSPGRALWHTAEGATLVINNDNWRTGVHFTHVFSSELEFGFTAIPLVAKISLQNSAHTKAAQLSSHLQQGKSEGFDSFGRPCDLKWDPSRFFSPLTFNFCKWPRKIPENLFHAPRCYMCQFIAIRAVVIWKRSNQSQIIDFTSPCVTLKFDGWLKKQ